MKLDPYISKRSEGFFPLYLYLCCCSLTPEDHSVAVMQQEPDLPWGACPAWPACCLFPLGCLVGILCPAGSGPPCTRSTRAALTPSCVPVCRALSLPSAESASGKDARDLFKGTKLRRVLHVPLLALVWTYWFTFHFLPFWCVIWYQYFSFMSLKLGWWVQWKIVLLSGICEWRINFQTSVSTYLSLQHPQCEWLMYLFLQILLQGPQTNNGRVWRKQGTWIETKYEFVFWRGLHDKGSEVVFHA